MLWLYINDSDRTGDLIRDKLKIQNQIQQRADSCDFTLFQGAKPSENQDVQLFVGDTIASAVGATMTLNGNFQSSIGQFYAGQRLFIRIGDADEEVVTILSYDEVTLTLVLTAAPSGAVAADDKIGFLLFGGVVSRVADKNIHVLTNIEYNIECVDYTKIFDRKLISDTWEDRTARYIINDFCNSDINHNKTIDSMNYDDNAAIQAEWVEGGDGDNPTIDSTNYWEGTTSGDFGWTFGGGSATFTASPTSSDVSFWTGAASGSPTKGLFGFWYKCTDYTKVTNFKVRIGSGAGDYAEATITPTSNDATFYEMDLNDATIAGTPVWTACDYLSIIITETADSAILFDGFRILQDDYLKHYPHVSETPELDDFRSPALKPTKLMQLLAKTFSYVWYIDYERYIHFVPIETDDSPFALTDSSNNFFDLRIEVDQSQLGNRIIVRGGEKTSDSTYSQAEPGDGARKEWLLKNKFKNLVVKIDDQSDTHAAAVATTTTNIKIVGHNLSTGDYIQNQTRNNEIRVITRIDADNFTVETIAAQTNGDTITFFTVAKGVGIEGLVDETAVGIDYVYNSNEKSVRATASEGMLNPGDGILFTYSERVPIQIRYSNSASIAALKALGIGDGIFDLDPYTDRNIQDIGTALAIAEAKVKEYSNAIISGSFTTDHFGLRAGQLLTITDSNRGIDETYVIQKVKLRQKSGEFASYFVYDVWFGTTLFGIIEFYQKLLSTQDLIEQNTDDIVETYVDAQETVESADVNIVQKEGDENAKNTETVESSDVNQAVDWAAGDWKFEASVGQTLESRFDLAGFA